MEPWWVFFGLVFLVFLATATPFAKEEEEEPAAESLLPQVCLPGGSPWARRPREEIRAALEWAKEGPLLCFDYAGVRLWSTPASLKGWVVEFDGRPIRVGRLA